MLKRFIIGTSVAGLASVLVAVPTFAVPPGCFGFGSGTSSDPFQIWTDTELSCLESASSYSPVSGAHYELMADIERTSATSLDKPHQIVFDGNNHTITISGVSNFPGLFGDTSNASVSNLVIVANSSTATAYAGWLAGEDINSTFSNIVVNAPISIYGGGIVGFGSSGTTISTSASTGAISNYGGGLVGSDSLSVTITNSFSTGAISDYGGGLVGSGSQQFLISGSFSTGAISDYGGGLVGVGSEGGTVSNSFSSGIIGDYGGGILNPALFSPFFGLVTNSYSTGALGYASEAISDVSGDVIVTNSYGTEGSAWSDSTANATLTGVPIGAGSLGAAWGSCGINRPYFIASFYSSNPCGSALPADVEVSGSDPSLAMSRTTVVGPADNSFSLTSTISSSPFSYVSVVNGTGTVTQGGTSCVLESDCIIRDVMQGPHSRGAFTITGNGTLTVKRFNSFTGDLSTVGTLTVSRIPTSTSEVVNFTLTLNPAGGVCGVNSVTVASGSSVTLPGNESCKREGHLFAGWFGGDGTRITTRDVVVTADQTLFARWSAPTATPVVRNRITARISRLTADAQVVRVRGRITGKGKVSDLQVWFKERGMDSFEVSTRPVVRDGRQFTWFHRTGNSLRVYVTANGVEQSVTLRTSGQRTTD